MEPQIIVRGSAETRVLPDRAVLHVGIEGEAGSREEAYGAASQLATQVDVVFADRSPALDRVMTAALLVQPKTRWRKGESVGSGWRASRRTQVEVVDLRVVGDLIAELAVAGADVAGPSWHLDPADAVHAEVRRLAAQDARARADAYAAALGLEISGVAWVAEPGLRHQQSLDTPVFAGAAAPGNVMHLAHEDVIEIAVEELTVSALVEVGFGCRPI